MQLYRLDFPNQILVIKYLLKRVLYIKTTEKEKQINEYYFHLITFNGFVKKENQKDFVAHYPDFEATIKIRKRPSSDLNVFTQIYHYYEYKPLVAVFKKNFPNDSRLNIIDAGCNIGLASIYMSKFLMHKKYNIHNP